VNTQLSRREILGAAAMIVNDMTVTDRGPGHWEQLSGYKEMAEHLRDLATRNHEAVGPYGGKGAGLKLREPQEAILSYLQHLSDADIHYVKVSIGDDGTVTWRERADAMLAEFLGAVTVKDKRVLSVGTNSGGDMMALLAAGTEHVTGLEMIPELVSLTSALMVLGDHEHKRWRMLGGNIENFTSPEPFDVVYNVGVFYHVENPMLVLRSSFEALRPGGWLCLETEIIKPHHDAGKNNLLFWPLVEPIYVKRGKNWPTWFIPSEEVLLVMLRCVGFVDTRRLPDVTIAKAAFVARKP
jgi:2-polyprenyl-3-methyl-5-hydroxy-6-metoxy-1,4-benzoquinol methylase